MTFAVYPDAATAALLLKPAGSPISLAAGEAMSAFAPLAPLYGVDAGDGLTTGFIRIAMSGGAPASPLKIEVAASNSGAATTGLPVTITATSIDAAQALEDGLNTTEAAAAFLDTPPSPNIVLLKVLMFIAGTTLSIRLTNATGAARKFVWVAADSGADAQQPWLDLAPPSLSFDALTNQGPSVADLGFTITNYGTGPATLTGFTPAPAAPYGLLAPLPGGVAPNQTVNGSIGFTAGGATGSAPGATLTLGSNDAGAVSAPGRNNQLQLAGVVTALELAFVLDDSGSMASAPDGGAGAPTQRRIDHLISVANLSLDLVAGFGNQGGKFGVVHFPGNAGATVDNLPSYDLVAPGPIGNMAAAKAAVANLQASGGTPMDYGLQRALGAAPAYFSSAPADVAGDVRWLMLLSDGAWNLGADPNGEIATLQSKKIKVFSVGFGVAGQVDYTTLHNLATATGGQAYQVTVDPSYDYNQLAAQFKAALKTGLTSLSSAADPDATYVFGDPPNIHPVTVTPYDGKAAFLITWNTSRPSRLQLGLQTPSGEVLDAESALAGKYRGVTFTQGDRHAMFVVAHDYLMGERGRTRFGVWTMLVSGVRFDVTTMQTQRDFERYAYDVIVESSLRLAAKVGPNRPTAGQEIEISARPTLRGLPLVGATVTAQISGPGLGVDNWLAAIPITQAEYRAAQDKLGHSDSSPVYVKAFVAQNKGFVYDAATRTATLTLIDENGTGDYRAKFASTQTPGAYAFLVSAQGQTPEGVNYLRQAPVSSVATVKPDPAFTQWDWNFVSIGDRTTLVLSFTPRDAFGNVLLLDPSRPGLVNVAAAGATPPQVTTLFDGAYSATITYPSASAPSLSVSVLGVSLLKGATPPNPATLFFANRVFGFRSGLEATPGANAHADPAAALGDIRNRATFLSLGAYGAATLGMTGAVILAEGQHDVVVFAQPDVDRRPYRVEAQDADSGEWIEIGSSPGSTQTFRLPRRRMRAASAVRIVDTSGRTRVKGAPSPTPGASIRGVGFARVAAEHYCLHGPCRCKTSDDEGRELGDLRGLRHLS